MQGGWQYLGTDTLLFGHLSHLGFDTGALIVTIGAGVLDDFWYIIVTIGVGAPEYFWYLNALIITMGF